MSGAMEILGTQVAPIVRNELRVTSVRLMRDCAGSKKLVAIRRYELST